ncbi:MAG TPA: AmmeMemoRadiSam system radical SAM enzyme [Candidatus Acidoferrales bacterium]|nr:AmmeMemoRadiSam system radical SAM enzyme [Candidatus Acidoferrales bacterium]
MAETLTLKSVLQDHTAEGELYTKLENDWVLCYACGHRCKIKPGRDGICKVRFNKDGKLFVPRGYAAGIQLDPIEKKPFFHAFPGRSAVSFGMLGCDYHCSYCQNWITSQAIRDPSAAAQPEVIEPEKIVELALLYKSPVLVSTYNEPLITSEWAAEIFKLAKPYGIRGAYVSNGNATPEVIDYITPYVDLYKVDLKGFDDKRYRQLGGRLEVVLNAIHLLKEKGLWVEIVTLLVPGFNDGIEELKGIAKFIASVSPEIPWHITAFHQDYKMLDRESTDAKMLMNAARIGKETGLYFVYAGNLPGMVENLENTNCHRCGELLVERSGFRVLRNNLIDGSCRKCKARIPGVWK